MTTVVTSGYHYLDIDAYGGCVAYAELLNLLGDQAVAATTAPLNESITTTIRSWKSGLHTDYTSKPSDQFVLIDISDPNFFDTFVDQARVVEILDHHMEFTDYWHSKLGDQAHIEFIGAACTLVFERWQATGKLPQMSETSARLLVAGILDNTLNFRASVTTNRDKAAYTKLMERANLPADWPAQYFGECEQSIVHDLKRAITNDVKKLSFPSFGRQLTVGQVVVWNGQAIALDRSEEVRSIMSAIAGEWLMSVVSIAEGKNYLLASDTTVQQFLKRVTGAKFTNGLGITNRLWLRKEIMKRDLDIQHERH